MISREQLVSGDYDRVDVSELLEAYLRLKKLLKQEFSPEDELPQRWDKGGTCDEGKQDRESV